MILLTLLSLKKPLPSFLFFPMSSSASAPPLGLGNILSMALLNTDPPYGILKWFDFKTLSAYKKEMQPSVEFF